MVSQNQIRRGTAQLCAYAILTAIFLVNLFSQTSTDNRSAFVSNLESVFLISLAVTAESHNDLCAACVLGER